MPPTPVGPTEALTRIAGKTFFLVGKLHDRARDEITERLTKLGAVLVDEVSPKLNYLVLPHAHPDRPTPEEKELESLGRHRAKVLRGYQLWEFLSPTQAEAELLLRAGEPGLEQWRLRFECGVNRSPINLSGFDLRNASLVRLNMYSVTLDGADLSGADLCHSILDKLVRVNLDGAHLVGARTSHYTDCTVRHADLTNAHWNPAEIVRTDFTGANLTAVGGSYTQSEQSIFRDADFTRAGLQQSTFATADFTNANFTDAFLDQCDLTGAILRNAKLVRTGLSRAKLVHADLTGADLTDANLAGADLTGAIIDGAIFTGAKLYAANVSALGPGTPVGFIPPAPVPVERIGPNMRKVEAAWREAGMLDMHLLLDPDGTETAYRSFRVDYGGREVVRGIIGDVSPSRLCQATTPCEVMLEMACLFPDAVLCLESAFISAGSKKKTPKELREVAVAAWHEAFGRPIPSPAERKAAQTAHREKLLAMLRGGPEGVARWNQVPNGSLLKAGHFRRSDLSGCDLRGAHISQHLGVRIGGLDFDRSRFNGANLTDAGFGESSLERVEFRGANLDKAWMSGANLTEADFEGASLRGARLGKCRGAIFHRADLTKADLRRADLRGADLTGAKLDGVRWQDAKYDDTTRFPDGFAFPPPPKKGEGLPPGVAVGSRMRISDGVFENFEGEVTAIDADTRRLTLRVVVLGRETPLELGFDDVGAAE